MIITDGKFRRNEKVQVIRKHRLNNSDICSNEKVQEMIYRRILSKYTNGGPKQLSLHSI